MTALLIAVAAVVAVPVTRFGLRYLFRALANRAMRGKSSRWRVRARRFTGESPEVAELRRGHRIDATATMASRLLAAIAWPIAAIVILDRLEVNVALAISGAGFVGVAIAFGGQASVGDFLAGLHILLEDRFGEGDQLQIQISDDRVIATVTALGAFATRLETDEATLHVSNRLMDTVVNLSQRGFTTTLEIETNGVVGLTRDDVERILQATPPARRRADSGVVVVEHVERCDGRIAIVVRAPRPIDSARRAEMVRTLEAAARGCAERSG